MRFKRFLIILLLLVLSVGGYSVCINDVVDYVDVGEEVMLGDTSVLLFKSSEDVFKTFKYRNSLSNSIKYMDRQYMEGRLRASLVSRTYEEDGGLFYLEYKQAGKSDNGGIKRQELNNYLNGIVFEILGDLRGEGQEIIDKKDEEYIIAVFEYVSNNFSYPVLNPKEVGYVTGSYIVYNNLRAFMEYGQGTCGGVASLVVELLNRLGFESNVVVGFYEELPHAWLKFRLSDGREYFADPSAYETAGLSVYWDGLPKVYNHYYIVK